MVWQVVLTPSWTFNPKFGTVRQAKPPDNMILGCQADLEVYDLDHYDEPDMILERVRKRVEEQPNDEFIILTDINNGSVHHQMMQLCLCPNVYVQTGMCLSMVLEILLASPQAGIEETVKHAVESTKENMLGFNFRSIREMKEDELW